MPSGLDINNAADRALLTSPTWVMTVSRVVGDGIVTSCLSSGVIQIV